MDCIEVTGVKDSRGYGRAQVWVGGKGYAVLAHLLLFEQTWGIRLRDDQVVRHSCDNPPCINPLHLLVGAQADNVRDRDQRGRHGGNQNSRKTHCLRGHALDESNTYLRKDTGHRQCKACGRQRQRGLT